MGGCTRSWGSHPVGLSNSLQGCPHLPCQAGVLLRSRTPFWGRFWCWGWSAVQSHPSAARQRLIEPSRVPGQGKQEVWAGIPLGR